jgi:hypothetical protein
LSGDLDLFFHRTEDVRELARQLGEAADEASVQLRVVSDAGIFVRAEVIILAMLLEQFPTAPMPTMLEPLSEGELRRFRDELRERLRRLALPAEP